MRAMMLAGLLVMTPVAAVGQAKTVSNPPVNQPSTVTAGDAIWESEAAATSDETIFVVKERVKGGGFFSTSGTIDIPAGAQFVEVPIKDGVRACTRTSTFVVIMSSRTCLIDTNNDGNFDYFSFNEKSKLGKLKNTVSYSKLVSTAINYAYTFKTSVIYSGVSSSSLLLSYREFSSGIARPAFTQEISIPLAATFPQVVRIKGVELKIDGIDGLGMRYAITAIPERREAPTPPSAE